MSKSYLISMSILLVWVSVTFGQGQAAPTAPTAEKAPEPPTAWNIWDGLKSSCFGETGPTRRGVFTTEAEYILWFLASSRDSQPIATTDILGRAGTLVLGELGDAEHERKEPGSGARFAVGYWQIEDNPWIQSGLRDLGAEATFFFVGQRSVNFVDNSSPVIARPFFDVNNRQESAFVVAVPGLATGILAGHAQADLWGAEANLWKMVFYDSPGTTCSVSMMAGFRFVDLDQRIDIGSISVFNQNLTAFPAFLAFAGNTLQVSDSFATHNRFYGGQIGIVGRAWPMGQSVIEGGFKLAIGTTSEDLEIVGSQLRTLANSTKIAAPAGLLALPSNIGNYHTDKFSQVPELTLKIATPLLSHLTLSTGFSALYWSRILRPGHQSQRDFDITQIPNFPPASTAVPTGLGQPTVPFRQSDLWALGIHVGVEIKW